MKYNLYFHCSENTAFYIFTAVKYSFFLKYALYLINIFLYFITLYIINDFFVSVSIHGLYVVVGLSVCTADSHHRQSADSRWGQCYRCFKGAQEKQSIICVRMGKKSFLCHHSASPVMPISDPRDWFFYPTITLTMDPYSHK